MKETNHPAATRSSETADIETNPGPALWLSWYSCKPIKRLKKHYLGLVRPRILKNQCSDRDTCRNKVFSLHEIEYRHDEDCHSCSSHEKTGFLLGGCSHGKRVYHTCEPEGSNRGMVNEKGMDSVLSKTLKEGVGHYFTTGQTGSTTPSSNPDGMTKGEDHTWGLGHTNSALIKGREPVDCAMCDLVVYCIIEAKRVWLYIFLLVLKYISLYYKSTMIGQLQPYSLSQCPLKLKIHNFTKQHLWATPMSMDCTKQHFYMSPRTYCNIVTFKAYAPTNERGVSLIANLGLTCHVMLRCYNDSKVVTLQSGDVMRIVPDYMTAAPCRPTWGNCDLALGVQRPISACQGLPLHPRLHTYLSEGAVKVTCSCFQWSHIVTWSCIATGSHVDHYASALQYSAHGCSQSTWEHFGKNRSNTLLSPLCNIGM